MIRQTVKRALKLSRAADDVTEDSVRLGDRGITLLEMLVVLVILGLLAALIAPQVTNYIGGARSTAGKLQMENIRTAVELYKLDVGAYPPADPGLVALVEQPEDVAGWNGPYLRNRSALNDPWGKPFEYRVPGTDNAFDIYSYGADETPGGDGEDADIVSW